MRPLPSLRIVLVMLPGFFAAPPPATPVKKDQDFRLQGDYERYLDYYSYMKDVVKTLESDPTFREAMLSVDEEYRRSAKVADHLESTSQHIRERLDKLKRREMDRLRHLAKKKFQLSNNLERDSRKVPYHGHLDHSNPHTFEMEDLKRLIAKTISDVDKIDELRRQQFKEYKMQKEFERTQKMANMTESEKKEFIEKLKNEAEAKKHHQPLHHPGSQQQLEEVWEKQDHMDQKFDPKVFFMMHDLDGNSVWDADELKALFVKELDKVYGPGGPNNDTRERAEEMERMREHVFREYDLNRDGLIDFKEFLKETQKPEYKQDEGWKTIDEKPVYTQSEYDEYQRRHLAEQKYLQQRGLVDDHGRVVPGTEQQIQQAQLEFAAQYEQQKAYQQFQAQANPQYQQQYPQGDFQQPPQGQFQPPQGQVQQAQGQFQPPQGQVQPPQGQFQPPQGQVQPPQGQFQPPQGQAQQDQGQFQAAGKNANVNQGQAVPSAASSAPAAQTQ